MNRMGIRLVIAAVVVAGVVGYRLLFVDTDEVVRFNDKLVDMVAQADKRFETLGGNLRQYSMGQAVDVAQMSQARDNVEKKVRQDLTALQQAKVPDNALCKEFHTTCVQYVENSISVAETYKDVIAHIAAHNPGEQTDRDTVDGLLAEVIAKDQALFKAVGVAQKKLATKFDFKLK
ncbi:MAG: hypothetical protein JXR37_15715 [Kiritimatiellae bacterium]|nr:hypothetical protein [Kiritimatiellia bacterium]